MSVLKYKYIETEISLAGSNPELSFCKVTVITTVLRTDLLFCGVVSGNHTQRHNFNAG